MKQMFQWCEDGPWLYFTMLFPEGPKSFMCSHSGLCLHENVAQLSVDIKRAQAMYLEENAKTTTPRT